MSAVLQPWVGYVLVAYTGMAVQVALTPDEFLTGASSETLALDGLRVALFSGLWISLTVALWKLDCWPQWFLDKRVGKPGKEAMPATIVVSFIHACAAVGAGIVLLAPGVAQAPFAALPPRQQRGPSEIRRLPHRQAVHASGRHGGHAPASQPLQPARQQLLLCVAVAELAVVALSPRVDVA